MSVLVQIQELGLAAKYEEDDKVHKLCRMLDRLAYLPIANMEHSMRYMCQNIPDVDGLIDLVTYFDNTYVGGSFQQINACRNGQVILRPIISTRNVQHV